MTSPKRFATTGLHDSVAFQPTQTASPNSDAPGDRSLCANGTTYRDRAAETDKLKTRIENSSASVIGIAGPRGAGKSSFALRVLDSCNSDSAFTHVVHSPTGYESREFLIAIFQSTCQKTVANINDKLKQDHLLTEPVDDERARFIFIDRFLRWFAPMLAVLLAVVIAYQIFVAREPSVEATFPPILSDVLNANLTLVILPLVLMFVLPSLSMWTRQFIRRKINILTSHRSEAKLKRRALDWSEHLRFQTSRSNTTQAKVSFLESLFGFSSTKNLITRDLSLPLLTSEFSSFLQEVCQVYPRVVICLDELDKIEDPEDLDKLLRGIKGVLGQHGVHFLLTVSDDALVRFSRRRQERGIVESAFESIEVLDRVDLEAADYMVDLMYSAKDRGNGRAPVHIATVLLWLFGGGIPREIKRNALACLEKGLRPRFESAERIWNVLFRARIDEVQGVGVERGFAVPVVKISPPTNSSRALRRPARYLRPRTRAPWRARALSWSFGIHIWSSCVARR